MGAARRWWGRVVLGVAAVAIAITVAWSVARRGSPADTIPANCAAPAREVIAINSPRRPRDTTLLDLDLPTPPVIAIAPTACAAR